MDKRGNFIEAKFVNEGKFEYLFSTWRFLHQIQGAKYQFKAYMLAHLVHNMYNSEIHSVLVFSKDSLSK